MYIGYKCKIMKYKTICVYIFVILMYVWRGMSHTSWRNRFTNGHKNKSCKKIILSGGVMPFRSVTSRDFSSVLDCVCDIYVRNWPNTMNISSALGILVAQWFSTKASAAMVLRTHPWVWVSSCLWVKWSCMRYDCLDHSKVGCVSGTCICNNKPHNNVQSNYLTIL